MTELIKFEGLIAAPFTPLNKDGSVNSELIEKYYELLENSGVKGSFINGTTGEGASLSHSEKRMVTESWTSVARQKKSIRIINLVGGTSYTECIESALHSYESGAYAIAVIAPYFFKPADIDHLASFCITVGEAVPALPLYFYNFPSLTGVNFPMIDLLKKISDRLPNFAGIKYTKEDFMDYLSCLNFENGKYDILWGRDECMLPALAVGAKGFVGSTYNYAAPLYLKLIEAFKSNDLELARSLQQTAINMISLLGKYGGIGAGKAYMRYIGLDCGKYRLPVSNVSEDLYVRFRDDVKELGIGNLLASV